MSGNILSNAAGVGRGVYVASPNFILEDGGAVLADGVYLSSNAYPIKLSRTVRQAGRRYNVELATPAVASANGFRVGDSVVIPEGMLESAAPNLRYFATDYEGAVLDRGTGNKAKNIVLKKIIFVDGVKGSDQNDGSTPDLAYKSFAAAKAALGSDRATSTSAGSSRFPQTKIGALGRTSPCGAIRALPWRASTAMRPIAAT